MKYQQLNVNFQAVEAHILAANQDENTRAKQDENTRIRPSQDICCELTENEMVSVGLDMIEGVKQQNSK